MSLMQKSLFQHEQFRMSRLQVFNWGTFSGLHDIPIAARGFLFVGRSGAGKSTLLDAFSALLIPPRWIDFNAAAREADRSQCGPEYHEPPRMTRFSEAPFVQGLSSDGAPR